MLGAALLGQGKLAEAEPLLVRGYEGVKEREGAMPPGCQPRVDEALLRLITFYETRAAEGDADRHGGEELAIADGEGMGEGRVHAARDLGGFVELRDLFEEDRELVAAQPCHGVTGADA